jgi:hypothetical protein
MINNDDDESLHQYRPDSEPPAHALDDDMGSNRRHFCGEPPVLHPAFAPGGFVSVVAHAEGLIPFDVPRIVYSEEDERALSFSSRRLAFLLTSLHSLPRQVIINVVIVPR